jgi:hypothetical protein
LDFAREYTDRPWKSFRSLHFGSIIKLCKFVVLELLK